RLRRKGPIRAPSGGQGLKHKEQTAMPRRFIRRENWEFGGAAPGSEETKEPRSRKRRLASTLVFTTIFFAGASLAAVAGDQLQPLRPNHTPDIAARPPP